MKIASIETIPYEIPYTHPLAFASGSVSTADHVLVRVTTTDGVVGSADAPPRPYTYGETQSSIMETIGSLFSPALVGTSIFDREKIHAVMRRTIHNQVAKGALDIAIWDAIGKTVGQPVHRLLGGYTDSMRVSHMLGFRPAAELVDDAHRMGEDYGITTFKIKVGRRPLSLDIETIRALRGALGDEVELYLDANRGWTANEAAEVLRNTTDCDLTMLEEPCDAKEAMSRRRLVDRSPIPVVADESAPTAGDASRELLNGGCSAICIKTARSGFTEATEILGLCTGLGVDVTMGNQIDTQIGSLATVAFGAAHEATSRRAGELSNFLDMSDDLILDPIAIRDGRISVRETAGVGADIDEEKLAAYRSDR
ncbi:MAG: enolase C-terminal domain-like protein [Microbacteriaceae bacterium]|uniref:enolase C-terminal domain-like protein n=1 Tax=unclassified Microbacterium TaxID=2609290 RepID=UPI00097F153F|nr:enolase C-terminal domain-like protein [Microbacterium sp. JB110]RCS60343.1 enolase [Microbacterium sp. JB110]SJM48875.1 Muconate cycloisomerase [Frigoribacterium sp. JB110]